MRNIIALALGTAVLSLSGCNTEKHGVVGIRTDGNGRHANTFIVTSTGDKDADRRALRAASTSFRKQVRTPLKNHRYNIPVVVHDLEPIFKNSGDKK